MIGSGYGDAKTIERRAQLMEEWIKNPILLEPDKNAEYADCLLYTSPSPRDRG